MNLNRFSSAALALLLAASTPALASASSDLPKEEVDVPIPSRYAAVVTVNGQQVKELTYSDDEETQITVKMSNLPGAPSGYVPMRLVCSMDERGYAYWSKEDHSAVFSLHGSSFIVHLDDLSVEMDGETVAGVKGYLAGGVTFLPVDFLASLEDVTVNSHPEMNSERYDITLENDPLLPLAAAIRDKTGMAMGLQMSDEDFSRLEVDTTRFENLCGFMPMMVNADTVFIGKYAPGADKAAAKADFEAQKARTIQNFENYLPGPLEMAKQGQIVESKDGKYLMLIISPDNEKAISMFEAGVSALAGNKDLEEALSGFPAA